MKCLRAEKRRIGGCTKMLGAASGHHFGQAHHRRTPGGQRIRRPPSLVPRDGPHGPTTGHDRDAERGQEQAPSALKSLFIVRSGALVCSAVALMQPSTCRSHDAPAPRVHSGRRVVRRCRDCRTSGGTVCRRRKCKKCKAALLSQYTRSKTLINTVRRRQQRLKTRQTNA